MSYSIHPSITEIHPRSWQELAQANNPFFDYEFLLALEEGSCLDIQTGWVPQYVVFKNENKDIIAAIPFYIKSHSYGEFIFDFDWAHAYRHYGFKYYPKIVSAIPLTPVSGNRILLKNRIQIKDIKDDLTKALEELVQTHELSSIHFLFCLEEESDQLQNFNFHKRHTFEYRWQNQNYQCFDDFLQNLNHKARQQIKKERKEAFSKGLEIEILTGNDIKEHHIHQAYEYYVIHHNYKYGSPIYLTQEFFLEAFQNMCDRMLLIMVKNHGKYVAGSINFFKGQGLYGRYWGHTEELKFMHFEACYYQQIEFAIKNKIQIFEAGAQGQHKIKRGLTPFYTYSSHWFEHQGFHQAIGKFITQEKNKVDHEMAYFKDRSPYKS